jgi:hypothetical protein
MLMKRESENGLYVFGGGHIVWLPWIYLLPVAVEK